MSIPAQAVSVPIHSIKMLKKYKHGLDYDKFLNYLH